MTVDPTAGTYAGPVTTNPLRPDDTPRTLHRVQTERGELALRQQGDHFEIISNGVFLMDTRDGRSERLLVGAALDRCATAAPTILIGGLGVGFTLAEARSHHRVAAITVVEIEATVIDWYSTYLGERTSAVTGDERVHIVRGDLRAYLSGHDEQFDIICLDVDNGPEWTVTDGNRELYGAAGLTSLRHRLRPGGVLSVWSAERSDPFETALRGHFRTVERHDVQMPRGGPDIVYVASD